MTRRWIASIVAAGSTMALSACAPPPPPPPLAFVGSTTYHLRLPDGTITTHTMAPAAVQPIIIGTPAGFGGGYDPYYWGYGRERGAPWMRSSPQ